MWKKNEFTLYLAKKGLTPKAFIALVKDKTMIELRYSTVHRWLTTPTPDQVKIIIRLLGDK